MKYDKWYSNRDTAVHRRWSFWRVKITVHHYHHDYARTDTPPRDVWQFEIVYDHAA